MHILILLFFNTRKMSDFDQVHDEESYSDPEDYVDDISDEGTARDMTL